MGLREKIIGWLDRDGDGELGFGDVKAGAQQAGAIVHRALDVDGDGVLSSNDVRMKYADVFDKKVKRAGSVFFELLLQPVFWIAVGCVLFSAVISYAYYSDQYPGNFGIANGLIWSGLCVMGLYMWSYYNSYTWRENPMEKVFALSCIVGIAISNIAAFAGMQISVQDKENSRKALQGVVTKTSVGSVKGGLDRMKAISKIVNGGVPLKKGELKAPRSVALIENDLDIAGQKTFCRKRSTWCRVNVYCPTRKRSKHCTIWNRLQSEKSLAIEWASLVSQQEKTLADAESGKLTTEVNTPAKVIAQMTGEDESVVAQKLGVRQSVFLELILQMVMHLATASAIKSAAHKKEAHLAMRQAEISEEDDLGGGVVGDIQKGLQEMIDNPQPVPMQGLVVTAPAAPPPAPVEAPQPVRLDQLHRWREEVMQESMGSWMSFAQAYDAYARWSANGGLIALPADGDDGFHAQIKNSRLLVRVDNPQFGMGYGGMIEKVAA